MTTTTASDSTLRKRIKSLISLSYDNSKVVQHHVAEAINNYDGSFAELCEKLQIPLSDVEKENLSLIIDHQQRELKIEDIKYKQEHPIFKVGQIIKHINYGYTGVIVEIDNIFKGDLQWYAANKKHPDRNQPWYHILVNQSAAATYAAQSLISGDIAFQEVIHPALNRFFDSNNGKIYLRNNEDWPE